MASDVDGEILAHPQRLTLAMSGRKGKAQEQFCILSALYNQHPAFKDAASWLPPSHRLDLENGTYKATGFRQFGVKLGRNVIVQQGEGGATLKNCGNEHSLVDTSLFRTSNRTGVVYRCVLDEVDNSHMFVYAEVRPLLQQSCILCKQKMAAVSANKKKQTPSSEPFAVRNGIPGEAGSSSDGVSVLPASTNKSVPLRMHSPPPAYVRPRAETLATNESITLCETERPISRPRAETLADVLRLDDSRLTNDMDLLVPEAWQQVYLEDKNDGGIPSIHGKRDRSDDDSFEAKCAALSDPNVGGASLEDVPFDALMQESDGSHNAGQKSPTESAHKLGIKWDPELFDGELDMNDGDDAYATGSFCSEQNCETLLSASFTSVVSRVSQLSLNLLGSLGSLSSDDSCSGLAAYTTKDAQGQKQVGSLSDCEGDLLSACDCVPSSVLAKKIGWSSFTGKKSKNGGSKSKWWGTKKQRQRQSDLKLEVDAPDLRMEVDGILVREQGTGVLHFGTNLASECTTFSRQRC